MSLGLMMPDDEALIWRGPMLMGALQQMLGQAMGQLDVLWSICRQELGMYK